MNSLSDYEQVRQDNIERNEAFLRSIGMDQVQSEIKAESRASKASSRGVSKRKHTAPVVPARRSSRVTIERLKSEDFSLLTQEERLKKEAELERMLKDKKAASYDTAVMNNAAYGNENEDRWTRLDDDPLSALPPLNQPSSDDYRNDDEFLNWGRSILTSISVASADIHKRTDSKLSLQDKSSSAEYIQRMRNLKCVESDVAKVTESRITSVWVHPSRERLLVAAGDKQGHFGIWDVDAPDRCANEYDSPCGIDGVYKYRPHVGNLARIYCPTNSPSDIHTVSYDGTVRMLDLNKEVFIQRFRASEGLDEMYFTDACEWIDTKSSGSSNEKNLLFAVRSDGYLSLIDFRKSHRGGVGGYAWTVDSGYKVQSVQHWPTNENYVFIANAGKGTDESSHSGQMSIYDIRMLPKSGSGVPKAVCQFSGHTKSINAAYASPDGHHIVSVSQDMTIRCWSCPEGGFLKSGNKPIFSHRPHDNHTGRWLSTFRPTWDPKSPHSFISGSMSKPRCVEIFDVIPANSESSGKVARLSNPTVLRSDALASVVSRNATHPTMDIIACANSSGRVHIFR
eukprot:GSChrysophyteH1.ASY1.ANO1.2048.1 assembled CDS